MILALIVLFAFTSCQESGLIESEIAPVEETPTETTSQRTQRVVNYDVIIKLVDHYGNTIAVEHTGLGGFAAQSQTTGQYFYQPRGGDLDLLEGLPEDTYRFMAYDGYFDGAGSSVVTLSSDLENEDGFIEVTLSYWSE